MLDSSSRFACAKPLPIPANPEWEEATFTRPMRSPFAEPARPKSPPAEIDVRLEEAALFETPKPALRRTSTAPPPRRSLTPPPPEETTSKNTVHPELLRAIMERDSTRLRQAIRAVEALDLAKTTEEPALDPDDFLETSTTRAR